MNTQKMKTLFLSAVLAFSMSGSALAVNVIPGYSGLDLKDSDGVSFSNPNASTVDINLISGSGYNTGILNWNKFNLGSAYTINYGAGTFINNVMGSNMRIAGEIKAANANLVFSSAINDIVIESTAIIKANSLVISTLELKQSDLASLRKRIEIDKKLDLEIKNPSGIDRFGIAIDDGSKITVTNRLDLVAAKIESRTRVDKVSTSPNVVYTTTDGIVFNLDNSGATTSIYSSIGQPAGKIVAINSALAYTKYTPPIDPPISTTSSPDPLIPLDRLLEQKELTPTSLNLDLTNGIPLNLAGTQMEVAPLEETKIVNNLDTNQFANDSIGAIAINDSANHEIAVSAFTPIGAAAQVNKNDLTPIGAASQVGNNSSNQEDEENYDFIIPAPVVE